MALRVGGYDYIPHPETGKILAVDKDTGEAIPTELFCVPVGSGIVTPQNARRNSERSQRNRAYIENAAQDAKLGKFNSLSIEKDFSALPPAELTRLVYLSTYLVYNDNKLCLRGGRQITSRDLPDILGISKFQAQRFLSSARSYIAVGEDGYLTLDNSSFIF